MLSFSLKIPANFTGDIAAQADEIIKRVTFDVEAEIKETHANSPATGRIYKRGSRVHRASRRGEAPAVDTGHLLNSFQSYFYKRGTGIVATNAEQAWDLESVKDRPYISVSIAKVLERY